MHCPKFQFFWWKNSLPTWNSILPVREELFGIERLKQHAQSLASAQNVSGHVPRVPTLQARLNDNASVLLEAYRASADEIESGRGVEPAAEWLLDNYHLVEEQIREIEDDLPIGFYRQLPKLTDGPFAGYPRVFGIAWAFVAHTDSHFDPDNLCRFINAYQDVQVLTIGELWAVAITLRIVLIENLRRLVDQLTVGLAARNDADQLTAELLSAGHEHLVLKSVVDSRTTGPLSESFAAQLAKRLRDQDPRTTPALEWLEEKLKLQGLSVDEVVQDSHQRQGASNVSIRNVITSMRLISDIDWAELFESISLVDIKLSTESTFSEMDLQTRNLYRSSIEQLSVGSGFSELEVADLVLKAAQTAVPEDNDEIEKERFADPGYHLIGKGRFAFERSIKFRPNIQLSMDRLHTRFGVGGYVSSIVLIAMGLLTWVLSSYGFFDLSFRWLIALVAIGFLPATEVATALFNRSVSLSFGAIILPGLELKNGVPTFLRTLIAVPTMLTNQSDLLEQIERLEVHYLSGIDGDLSFALLTDGVDANEEVLATDKELLLLANSEIEKLNERYSAGPAGNHFLLLHRRRQFNASENKWMGWERKRGKLQELNQLLRGATDTSYVTINGETPQVPDNVRYVITLDSDTQLPRDVVLRLIGKMAHPLNRPRLDSNTQKIIAGYAILQPRVTPSLPVGQKGSLYQRVFSSPGGIDPYAAAISDVYQDLFGEGSFTGKGIYDIDAFEAVLAGRVAENTMLSHDLFEGIFARAGLISDVEVVEEFPARYDVAAKRQHRWTRGDWQLLRWILGGSNGKTAVSSLGRWKILDNLRRSLIPPFTLAALALCWFLPIHLAVIATALVLMTIVIPALLHCLFSFVPHRRGVNIKNHFRVWLGDLRLALAQAFLLIAFLPDQSWRMIDAISRTLWRLLVSHHHLLEWTTAARSNASPRLNLSGFYQNMFAGTLLGLGVYVAVVTLAPQSWLLALPFGILWLLAPILALWVSRAPKAIRTKNIDQCSGSLRLTARRTWRYFETFVTPVDNMLPPDNFQENPEPVVAHRTSPTNIGLYLLSAVAARDFGWAGTLATLDRLEATFFTLHKLPRYKGHFFNWYSTDNLETLSPAYISSVDSGNFAGHLITLANSCDEWCGELVSGRVRQGILDNLQLVREAAESHAIGQTVSATIDEIVDHLSGEQTLEVLLPILVPLIERASRIVADVIPNVTDDRSADLLFWIEALQKNITELQRDQQQLGDVPDELITRLQQLAKTCREMALAMDFSFLMDEERKLLSIGYSLSENSLDPSCYDLLASEARLASLFAIAKGDAPTKHWFRLGRTATPLGNGSALISWSGSMFEYLMPSLVMLAPLGSLLEQTNRLVVEHQQRYAKLLGIPWGISESGFNARDIEFTYQYSNFGVPGLGLKRGLSENRVIAPYATGLATMVDALAAEQNYEQLRKLGALGRYGYYEALDYTHSRLPKGTKFAIVHSYMAHHQGMTIVSILNTLHEGEMRRRFHREPIIQACELLLHERIPRDVAISHPRAEEVKSSFNESASEVPTARLLSPWTGGAPITHLLSNRQYAVMLTAAGGGYSRWRDIAITRWKEDTSCDNYGSYIFLRDVDSGKMWSSGSQPIGSNAEYEPGIFEEDHAEYIIHDGSLSTTMDVVVSCEVDGEVRRITLSNNGRSDREIELTSYAELVLTSAANDNAHPAFAKMFVQTEFVSEFDAVVATRRKRSDQEEELWAAHFAVVEGETTAEPQYETSRPYFIGRGNTVATAAAFSTQEETMSPPLSNTVGTVLDPIFSLRYRVKVPAGKLARVSFWTVVASSRAKLIDLIDQHNDISAFDRAKTLAWTQAQVQLRHLGIGAAEAADFQRLAAPILYADPRFRAPAEAIINGMDSQSALWVNSISGDFPIVLLHIDEIEDMPQVKQLLRAHEYWRMKQLDVDLVIINEHASSYFKDLQNAIEAAVRSSQSRPRFNNEFTMGPNKSSVHVLRADLISSGSRELLKSIARVVLFARRGSIGKQFERLTKPATKDITIYPRPQSLAPQIVSPTPSSVHKSLELFNGLGGFDLGGCEYVIILQKGVSTPAPWINVIANPNFGFQVAAEGSGYTWSENSRENQLTLWSNDPVSNPVGEAIYVRDEDSKELFCTTAHPMRDSGSYIARHGHGYSRFEHQVTGIELDLLQYVPLDDSIKISRLTLRNRSSRRRRLSVTAFTEWVLGTSRAASGPFITTELDPITGAILIKNKWGLAFPGRVAFADMCGKQAHWTTDRTEFLGRNGDADAPNALIEGNELSGLTGAGHDPCSALQYEVELQQGESIEIVVFMGQSSSSQEASALIKRYRELDLDTVLKEVKQHWESLLGAIQVKTPDRAMDIMLNGWLLYQTLACRIWARSAFYQASGAYGFRDQLQDGMALTFSRPEITRAHILRAASRQFTEGDVQHWWLPHSGNGVRTHISDDRVWLSLATATYIKTSGDKAILDEQVPFIQGPPLGKDEHDAYFQPLISTISATLFEHCARGLDQCLKLTGEQGLPLMGTGDWNDGMNRVGAAGRGESVWLAWLLIHTIELIAPLALERDNEQGSARAERWVDHARTMKQSVEDKAWDGEWYRRATFDDGSWLGSSKNDECRIDSIAQSWAVLSAAADSKRATRAMESVEKNLIRPKDGLAVLFTPPFDKTVHDPGYIKGYPPGLRENGGQYSHAAMWSILAFTKLGQADNAVNLFNLLNPINHALDLKQANRYVVEPYVVAADVYSVAPHIGRGGWTWYTGAAGWMYRAGIEGILGIRREGNQLVIQPCIPATWPGFQAKINIEDTHYTIEVKNITDGPDSELRAVLDGINHQVSDKTIRVKLDGGIHELNIFLSCEATNTSLSQS